jgi:hypothetical protein
MAKRATRSLLGTEKKDTKSEAATRNERATVKREDMRKGDHLMGKKATGKAMAMRNKVMERAATAKKEATG